MDIYIERKIRDTKNKISESINESTDDDIVETHLSRYYKEPSLISFNQYYFKIFQNEEEFLSSKDFFKKFKKQYALQGIDNDYLERLENSKEKILSLLKNGKVVDIYFDYFAKALIKNGFEKKEIEKELNSFFTKFVHTFLPNEYCALDNPIKDYLRLKKEGFFLAHHIISKAYLEFSKENPEIIKNLKKQFKELDDKRYDVEREKLIYHERITDLKLLKLRQNFLD